jgi:hypothetical protein
MGSLYDRTVRPFPTTNHPTFIPRFTWDKAYASPPEVWRFQELILQAIVRQRLADGNLQNLLEDLGLKNLEAKDFEVLGEKAFPEGHVDILIKEATPAGLARKLIVEVKTGRSDAGDVTQLSNYMKEIGDECIGGALIACSFPTNVLHKARSEGIGTFVYSFRLDLRHPPLYTFEELKAGLQLVRL